MKRVVICFLFGLVFSIVAAAQTKKPIFGWEFFLQIPAEYALDIPLAKRRAYIDRKFSNFEYKDGRIFEGRLKTEDNEEKILEIRPFTLEQSLNQREISPCFYLESPSEDAKRKRVVVGVQTRSRNGTSPLKFLENRNGWKDVTAEIAPEYWKDARVNLDTFDNFFVVQKDAESKHFVWNGERFAEGGDLKKEFPWFFRDTLRFGFSEMSRLFMALPNDKVYGLTCREREALADKNKTEEHWIYNVDLDRDKDGKTDAEILITPFAFGDPINDGAETPAEFDKPEKYVILLLKTDKKGESLKLLRLKDNVWRDVQKEVVPMLQANQMLRFTNYFGGGRGVEIWTKTANGKPNKFVRRIYWNGKSFTVTAPKTRLPERP